MKTTIIIIKRGAGYTATIGAATGTVLQGARCGLTPHDAAAWASTMMLRYASLDCNAEGGVLMAPPEVIELVPTHLRSIEPTTKGVDDYLASFKKQPEGSVVALTEAQLRDTMRAAFLAGAASKN